MTEPLSLPVFRKISRIVDGMGLRAYVIGGYVRDYYLCRPCTDIDVVVVGSGIDVAEALARETGSNVTVFKTFGTAMLRTEGMEVEFVGARKESYSRDSRKPVVLCQSGFALTGNSCAATYPKSVFGCISECGGHKTRCF